MYLKHRSAADRKALMVACYLTLHPDATLERIGKYFSKSKTWAKMYKDRALSGDTEWQWLKPSEWQVGDHVHTINHTLVVTTTGRTDRQVWARVLRRNKQTALQTFSEWQDRKWPVTRAELVN